MVAWATMHPTYRINTFYSWGASMTERNVITKMLEEELDRNARAQAEQRYIEKALAL